MSLTPALKNEIPAPALGGNSLQKLNAWRFLLFDNKNNELPIWVPLVRETSAGFTKALNPGFETETREFDNDISRALEPNLMLEPEYPPA